MEEEEKEEEEVETEEVYGETRKMSPIPSRNGGDTDSILRLSLFFFIYTPSYVFPPLVTSRRI